MDPLGTISTLANYQELKRAQRLITDQLGTLEKAEQCGIECQAFRDAAAQVMERLSQLEEHFFNPPPTK